MGILYCKPDTVCGQHEWFVRWNLVGCFTWFFFSARISLAQVAPVYEPGTATILHFTESFRASIPDPEDRLSLTSLVSNSYVAKELGLNAPVADLLKQAERKNGGPLSISVSYSEELLTSMELQTIHTANQRKWTELCDEALTPDQWKRLRELAYQIEVYRVGFDGALTAGRLGSDVGVFENQKSRLSQKASQIEKELKQAIVVALAATQESVLSELSSDQHSICKERLGDPFLYRRDVLQHRRMVDPEKKLTLVGLVGNASVLAELGLNERSLKVLRDRLAVTGGSLNLPMQKRDVGESRQAIFAKRSASMAESERIVDEALTPSEWKRLREIGYQIEVYENGFVKAFRSGSLGKQLNVTESQLQKIEEKVQQAENEQRAEFVTIMSVTQNKMLAELSPEQRNKAQERLGKPFYFFER